MANSTSDTLRDPPGSPTDQLDTAFAIATARPPTRPCLKETQSMMPNHDPPAAALIDVDGVLHIDGDPIPGAVEALARLREMNVPFRLLTNTTVRTRASLGALLRDLGFHVADDEIITAPVARRRRGTRAGTRHGLYFIRQPTGNGNR